MIYIRKSKVIEYYNIFIYAVVALLSIMGFSFSWINPLSIIFVLLFAIPIYACANYRSFCAIDLLMLFFVIWVTASNLFASNGYSLGNIFWYSFTPLWYFIGRSARVEIIKKPALILIIYLFFLLSLSLVEYSFNSRASILNVNVNLFMFILLGTFCFWLKYESGSVEKIYSWMIFLIILIAQAYTQTRKSMPIIIIIFLYLFWKLTLFMKMVLSFLILACSVFYWSELSALVEDIAVFKRVFSIFSGVESQSLDLRSSFFEVFIDSGALSSLFGMGLRGFEHFTGFIYSHSNYIEVYFNYGITAFLIMISILILLLKYYFSAVKAKDFLVDFSFLYLMVIWPLAAVTYDTPFYWLLLGLYINFLSFRRTGCV